MTNLSLAQSYLLKARSRLKILEAEARIAVEAAARTIPASI